ncbi:hypothetical protein [Mycobacterium sp. 1081908.1]|uniref:2Fe-2S iron-sulfur cluster-binding protein n=1 Tax=Mycobacterium sp. 1081908.1 TaxID=1834066 RepID=UPI000B29DFB2|nr:hypothetical protein [Mycobacterium sp. 1081908.1]
MAEVGRRDIVVHAGARAATVATLVSGEVEMVGGDVLGPQDRAEGLILCCQARPLGDHVHVGF